jgi:hypothetical protein
VSAPMARTSGNAVPRPQTEALTVKEQVIDFWVGLVTVGVVTVGEATPPHLATLAAPKFPGTDRATLRKYAGDWLKAMPAASEEVSAVPTPPNLRVVSRRDED